jgi:RecA/RadA recombinase
MAAKKKATSKKKTTAKKASPLDSKPVEGLSRISPPKLVKQYSYSELDDDNADVVELTRETLHGIQSKRKNCPTGFRTMAEIQRSMVPFRHFYMQWALASYGLVEGCVMEIIGAEHLGKSTLCFWFMGGALEVGVPCALQETENKELTVEWSGRALSNDRAKAANMLKRIGVMKTFSLAQMDEQMVDWFEVRRGVRPSKARVVPLDTPMLMVVDSWSKMLSSAEAAGVYDYGDNLSAEKKRKAKDTGEASNFGHSKFAQAWTRKLPAFLNRHNGCIIMVSHQNDKVDMSGGSSFMAADVGALYNKTKIGGRALNQNSAVQLIMAHKGLIKDANNEKIGSTVRLRVAKNSYGPKERVFEYDLYHAGHDDTDTWLSPSIDFDRPMCDMFAEQGILQTTVERKRYSSPILGITGATAREFSAAFHANTELKNEVGAMLGIRGYETVVDEIKEAAEGAPPPPPEDDDE